METIKSTFTRDRFTFRLLDRCSDIALLSKRKATHKREHYEVVRIQRSDAFSIAGRTISAREHMPSDEQWGTAGWSYSSLADAKARFDSLVHPRSLHTPDLYGEL